MFQEASLIVGPEVEPVLGPGVPVQALANRARTARRAWVFMQGSRARPCPHGLSEDRVTKR